jgi:hypothetical protein
MTVKISTKGEMYQLLYAGRFGNYPLAWRSVSEVEASGFTGRISVRSRHVANPVRLYGVPVSHLSRQLRSLPDEQRNADLIFSEFMPHETHGGIQGEFDGFNLTYTFHRAPMRIALERQLLHADGPRARWLLKRHLEASDYEWLDDLLADFPNHVVEFSSFSCRVGTLRRRTIFWEVRAY